ncbi:hypothetical protein PTKIN_Ptkin04bG0114500 [Pterospermum kingtungense]
MGRRMSEACRLADLKWQKAAFAANFVGIHGRRRFEEEFANRPVKAGRLVDLDFLHKIEFPYLKAVEEFGWITYLTSGIEVFDGLVKIFYTNAMKISDECFSTYIMGKYYEIKRGTIAEALGIADEGEEYNAYKDHKTLSFSKKVLGKRSLRVAPRYAKVLKMHDRLLHLIVTYILTPSGTSYSVIQRRDYWLMAMIKSGKKPNLPGLIFNDMLRIVEATEPCTLLYGMLLSLMFAKLNVDTSCDLGIMHQSMTVIGKRSVHSFGYRQNKNGEWVKKEDIGSDSEGELEMDFEEMENGDEDEMNVEGGQGSIAELAATIDDVKGRVYNVEKQTKKILELLTAMHARGGGSSSGSQ